MWRECYRVLKPGGILLSGVDSGINYLFGSEESIEITNKLPFNPLKNEVYMEQLTSTNSGIQFSHTLEEQIGGQLKAGLTLVDIYEDSDHVGIGEYISNFFCTKSIKLK